MSTHSGLKLRNTFDYKKQSESLQQKAQQRHKGYLKEMLVSKFLANYRSSQNQVPGSEYDIKVHTIVNREFEKFIDLQAFTQNKLAAFEEGLRRKLRGEDINPNQSVENPNFKGIERRLSGPKIDVDLQRMSHNISLPQIANKNQGLVLKGSETTNHYMQPSRSRGIKLTRNLSNMRLHQVSSNQEALVGKKGLTVRNSQKEMRGLPLHKRQYDSIDGSIQKQKQIFQHQSALSAARKAPQTYQQIDQNLKSMPLLYPIANLSVNAANLARLEKETPEIIEDGKKQQENDRYKKSTFADIRVKLGDKNIREQEAVPSEISENAWDEVPKYEAMKLKFDLIKEKENRMLKKKQVMNTLDQQVQEHRRQKVQAKQKVRDMDEQILAKAREDMAQEKHEKIEKMAKVAKAKSQRDRLLLDAKSKKEQAYQQAREQELEEVRLLSEEIQKEKLGKQQKRRIEMEVAKKVIAENEAGKAEKLEQKQQQRQADIRDLEYNNEQADVQERKRAEEWAKREKRIQDAMGRMADTVIKKSNAAEKETEKRVMDQAMQRDRANEAKEKAQKDAARKRDQDIRSKLDEQLVEKREAKQRELQDNKKYIQMVMEQDQKANDDIRRKKIEQRARDLEIQKYQRMQMGDTVQVDKTDLGAPSVTSITKRKRQGQIGGPMTAEEMRLNKSLLEEISHMKKRERESYQSPGGGSPEMQRN